VTQALDRDTADISALRDAVKVDIEEARSTFKAVENLRLPNQFQQTGNWTGVASDSDFEDTSLLPYFEKSAREQDGRLKRYNEQVLEIEAHLRTVEGSAVDQTEKLLRRRAGQDTSKERVLELVGAMRGFEDAVFRVASKVGDAREGVIECTMGSISGSNTAGRSTNGRLAR
jgi:nucleoporin p58/p45